MKTEVDKLDINKLLNVPTGLNNLKTNVYDLDDDQLETVFVDLKKLSDTVSKEIVKKMVCNNLNPKVSDLENKIPDVSTLIQTNQYNTDKQIIETKTGDADKKIPDIRQKTKQKRTLVHGNAGDEKNLRPQRQEFYY